MGDDFANTTSRLRLDEDGDTATKTNSATTSIPLIRSSNYIARDITDDFFRASRVLKVGQLVKHDTFSLFESVGALEIMDPKMDSGMLAPGEVLEDTYDVLKELLPEEVVGIMDQIFCYEMAWHTGYPLSQTLFTSIHIDRILSPEPQNVEEAQFLNVPSFDRGNTWLHRVLRAYCLSVIKVCDMTIQLITSQHYYEEEDFVTNTCNRAMLNNISPTDIMDILHDARNLVMKEMSQSPLQRALETRLTDREFFLSSLMVENMTETRNLARKCFEDSVSTHSLGRGVPAAFSAKIQRRLASTVPPRPIIELTYEAASTYFLNLLDHVEAALRVLELELDDSPQDLISFLWDYTSRAPEPCTFARALLQHFLFGQDRVAGIWPIEELIVNELRDFVVSDERILDENNWMIEQTSDARHKTATLVDQFLVDAAPSYRNILQALCQNRCRIRRNLQHLLMDFDGFTERAYGVDEAVRPFLDHSPLTKHDKRMFSDVMIHNGGLHKKHIYATPLWSWTMHWKCKMMEWMLQLGFEQELYSPNELAEMYQHLFAFADSHREHIIGVRNFLMIHHGRLDSSREGERRLLHSRFMRASGPLFEVAGVASLAGVITAIYVMCMRFGLLGTAQEPPYSNRELREEARMKPFINLKSPPYEKIDEANIAMSMHLPELIKYAKNNLERLKRERQMQKDIVPSVVGRRVSLAAYENESKQFQRATIAAGIALTKLEQAISKYSPSEVKTHLTITIPEPAKCHHKWWIVPVVEEKSIGNTRTASRQ